jgi:hypothetical protein
VIELLGGSVGDRRDKANDANRNRQRETGREEQAERTTHLHAEQGNECEATWRTASMLQSCKAAQLHSISEAYLWILV